jgi:hypothetical protein
LEWTTRVGEKKREEKGLSESLRDAKTCLLQLMIRVFEETSFRPVEKEEPEPIRGRCAQSGAVEEVFGGARVRRLG